jgi:hypothetical protein
MVNIEVPQSSPLHLHPNESLSFILIQPPLTENNYHQWCRAMRVALFTKNKFGFVNGSIVVPDRFDNLYRAWEMSNNMVISWILNVVSSTIAQSIIWLNTTHEI